MLPALTSATSWAQTGGHIDLSLSQLHAGVRLDGRWKYHPGDQPSWAVAAHDDSDWEPALTLLAADALPDGGWPHVGWFRLRIRTDSTIGDEPLALTLDPQFGATEIYLDGRLIYRFGRVGGSATDEETHRVPEPLALQLSSTATHLMAVRHSNFSAPALYRTEADAGFELTLSTLSTALARRLKLVETYRNYQWFFAGLLSAFAVLHLILFLFYPNRLTHLNFALLCGALTVLVFVNFQIHFTTDLAQDTLYERLWRLLVLLVALLGLRVVYSLFSAQMPRRFLGFAAVAAGLGVAACFRLSLQNVVYLFVLVVCLEILRIVTTMLLRQRSGVVISTGPLIHPLWIIPPGVIGFVLLAGYQILLNLGMFAPVTGLEYPYLFGVVVFLLSVSIYLSFDFAQMQRALERQLAQTKLLSGNLQEVNEGLDPQQA